jgi:Rrf2 family protein
MITSKSRYALKIMLDMASQGVDCQQKRSVIARKHGIPVVYMDHILASLKKAKLLTTIRGRSGGLQLACDPKKVSVWQIFSAVEVSLLPVVCLESRTTCDHSLDCISKEPWQEIFDSIKASLSKFILQDLVDKFEIIEYNTTNEVLQSIQECKGPRRATIGVGIV